MRFVSITLTIRFLHHILNVRIDLDFSFFLVKCFKTKIRKEIGKPEGQRKKVKGAKSDAGTGKYKRRADDKKAYAARAKKAGFKSTQNYTDVVARYGGEDNYKKGKGLGT